MFVTGVLSVLPVLGVYSLPVETYASRSRLAEGKWVKVRVNEEGMQYVSNETLKKMGFSSPETVRVYGYGGTRLPEVLNAGFADDLPLRPSVRVDGGIMFYGTGTVNRVVRNNQVVHEQNPYSTASYYFLSDAPLREGESGEFPEYRIGYGSDDVRVQSFTQYILHEQELVAPGNTGSDLLGEDFRTTTTRTFEFDLPGAVNDLVSYNVAFGYKSVSVGKLTLASGGEEVGTLNLPSDADGNYHIRVARNTFKTRQTEPGKGVLTLSFAGSGVISKALLDYIECSYERELRLGDKPLMFSYHIKKNEHKVFNISGVNDQTVIWDVTDPARTYIVKYDLEGDVASFAPASTGLCKYVVFNPGMEGNVPASVGTVSNQDIHSMETPDMVIITPKEFKTQAERVADLHRTEDAMTVYVLTPEVIYNEFSSGSPEVSAFRKMLKMWYDRTWKGENRTGYCLLFGRPTYDQRELTDNLKGSKYPRILTRQSSMDLTISSPDVHEEESYLTDNYIAMLDDSESLSIASSKLRVGVGRMPVKSVTEARLMADKLIKFVTEPDYGAWRNNVLILADDGNGNEHARQSQSMYTNMLKNGGENLLYERMYIDAYDYGTSSYKKTYPQAKSKMLKLLDEGVSLWTYVGHANPTSLTAEDMWTYTDLSTMTNKHWPVMYTASCEFVRFDSDAVSGCETMWLTPDAGIIAAIAANRKVFVSNNGWLTSAFGNSYYKRGADNLPRRLGEVYIEAINNVQTDENKHRYAVMGDPAMRVPVPTYEVNVQTIADCEVENVADEADYPVVPGLSKVKVAGNVTAPDGTVAADFNGTLVATLFDGEVVVTTKGHTVDGSETKPYVYNDRKNKLFSGHFPVKGGEWEATLLLPEEIENVTTRARITLHAANDDESTVDAAGSTDKFYVYGWADSEESDTKDPEILYMYLNNSAFRNGATVGPNPVFKVKVRDESGINISSAGVGRMMTIVVDGNIVYDNLSDYYVTDAGDPCAGTVAYTLTGLGEGAHALEYLVWDNAGNSSRAGLNFTIAPQSEIPDLNIYTDASPAISSVTFYIDSPEAVAGLVEVFDLSGRRIWYNEAPRGDGALSAKWNLCDAGGSRVPRGIYLYRATVRDSSGNEHKATKKFAVGNP
ncbi:MAG: type IX secretion system sortase PorU [Prevotella sp.]|nr:type IX secretion system sortase PorU [Prevotella sp.]MCM1075439.1 type IX secretion system sortase PorU [Ruminococcus sp.]